MTFTGAEFSLQWVKEDPFEVKIIKFRNEWEINHERSQDKPIPGYRNIFVQRPWGKRQKQE